MEKDAPNMEWDAKARTLFGHCTFLFEIMFKLPLCLFYPVEVLCALTTVLSAHKLKISFPVDYLQSSFHIDMNVILKCHDDLIFTASEIETMDKYFRVLPHIPRISHIDIKSVFSGQVESTLRDSLRDDDSWCYLLSASLNIFRAVYSQYYGTCAGNFPYQILKMSMRVRTCVCVHLVIGIKWRTCLNNKWKTGN